MLIRACDRYFKIMMVACFGLLGVSAIPLEGDPAKVRDQGVEWIRTNGEAPLRFFQLLGAEMVLYLSPFRRRIALTHELGHSLAIHQMDKALHAGKTDGSKTPGFMSESICLHPFWGADASPLSQQLQQKFNEIIRDYDKAKNYKLLYLPGFQERRKEIQEFARLKLMVNMAGPMLEGYILGVVTPWSDLGDSLQNRECLEAIADCEKPPAQWQSGEYRAFCKAEKQKAYDGVVRMITSLDQSQVRALIEQCLKEAKGGKTVWSGEELTSRLDALFAHTYSNGA